MRPPAVTSQELTDWDHGLILDLGAMDEGGGCEYGLG
jgi:hypothetical protein